MDKKNCWDYWSCGRGPGGRGGDTASICPAAISCVYNGYNNGKNAGRYCWRVNGSFAKHAAVKTMKPGISNCIDCEFFKKVKNEEGLVFRI